jgi:hypothetical protein
MEVWYGEGCCTELHRGKFQCQVVVKTAMNPRTLCLYDNSKFIDHLTKYTRSETPHFT